MTAFPIEEALKTMRADQLNAAVSTGDKLTITGITIHKTNTHEELQEVTNDNTHYFRVAGELATGAKIRRVQVPLASIFGAIVVAGTKAKPIIIPMLEHLTEGESKTIDLTSLTNKTIKALIPLEETNALVIDKLGAKIKRTNYKFDGTEEGEIHARFAMTDHKDYPALKLEADKKNARVNYVTSALSGVSENAIPLRQLVFVA